MFHLSFISFITDHIQWPAKDKESISAVVITWYLYHTCKKFPVLVGCRLHVQKANIVEEEDRGNKTKYIITISYSLFLKYN